MAGVTDTFRAVVRAIVGLPVDPGEPPDLMRLGLYRARVDTCANDGSTVDVTPEDKRISPEKGVNVRVGVPGSYAAIGPGAVVHLGWVGGDPAKPYCAPIWDIGASVTKFVINADAIELGGSTYSLAKWDDFFTDFVVWVGALNTLIGTLVPITGATGGPAYTTATGLPASLVVKMAAAANYKSTKVKNG